MSSEDAHSGYRRILSIDGGGILGTFPASFLAGLEEHLDKPIGQYFDLIAGTSTGGIIAIALALGHRAATIRDLYVERGAHIFGQDKNLIPLHRLWRYFRRIVRSKYDQDCLRNELAGVFQECKLGDAITRLLIPSWNPDARTVYIYKTAHHERLRNDYKALAVDVALATSAAPTYFPQHVTTDSVRLIDGGIWANNPTGLAVVEAIGLLGWPADRLQVMSIGCLDNAYILKPRTGIGALAPKITQLFMDGQSKGSMGIAKLLTNHGYKQDSIYRIDHTVPEGYYSMDDTRMIASLQSLGKTKAREELPRLQKLFFSEPAEPFTPTHTFATS